MAAAYGEENDVVISVSVCFWRAWVCVTWPADIRRAQREAAHTPSCFGPCKWPAWWLCATDSAPQSWFQGARKKNQTANLMGSVSSQPLNSIWTVNPSLCSQFGSQRTEWWVSLYSGCPSFISEDAYTVGGDEAAMTWSGWWWPGVGGDDLEWMGMTWSGWGWPGVGGDELDLQVWSLKTEDCLINQRPAADCSIASLTAGSFPSQRH